VARIECLEPFNGFLDQLLNPSEPPLPPSSPVESISLDYPEREVSLLGWKTHWLVVFFILTMVVAFALRKPFDISL
ncbi:MAG: hypothetical protein ACE5HV_07465, partial [Acidobacteriota bacterium]